MLSIEYLNTLKKEEALFLALKEYKKCVNDVQYTIETYFSVKDAETGKEIPFLLYPHQKKIIQALNENRYNISMKSRQMGFTTFSEAYIAWYMCTHQGHIVNVLANKLKTSRKLLRGVKRVLNDARKKAPWLVPNYSLSNNGKDSFTLTNNCMITAESNNDEACRGETINLLVIDESLTGENLVTVRNKKTKEISTVNMQNLYNILNNKNGKQRKRTFKKNLKRSSGRNKSIQENC